MSEIKEKRYNRAIGYRQEINDLLDRIGRDVEQHLQPSVDEPSADLYTKVCDLAEIAYDLEMVNDKIKRFTAAAKIDVVEESAV